MHLTSYRYEIILLLSLFVALIAFQGSRGLYETTEGRYAECARQTMLRGNLAEPWLNGDYHWTKPPLTYIAIIAGLRTFGVNTWGARAFLVPVYLLTVLVVYAAGRLLWDRPTGLFSALVYGSSPFVIATSCTVSTDTLLTLWECCAIFCFWAAVCRNQTRWVILMWLSFGLAFLTKGPPAMLPLTAIVVVFFLMRRRSMKCPNIFNPAGLAVFAVVGFSWYLFESIKHPGLMAYWLKDEVINRNVSNEFHRNPEFSYALLTYLPIVCLGALPWVYLCVRHFRCFGLPRGKELLGQLTRPESIVWTYLALAVVIPFVIFSVSKSKLPLYMLPLFMPICLMLGRGLKRLVDLNAVRMKTVWILYACILMVFIVVKAVTPFIPSDKDMKQLAARMKAVDAHVEDHPVYLIYNHPMNGLQFYLGRIVPNLDSDEITPLLSEAQVKDEMITVIMKSNDLDDFTQFTSQPAFQSEGSDMKWSMIIRR